MSRSSYAGPDDLPALIPLFPLTGALLLPRGQMPLNIFEPRYLAMIDQAIAGERVIGMVQPAVGQDGDDPRLAGIGCAGRITQMAETGDGRYLVTLTGICRFAILAEEEVETPFRQARVSYRDFAADLHSGFGEEEVDRPPVLEVMRAFADATGIGFDWDSVNGATNEQLINALSMLAPFGAREKQALLEAGTLKLRAETLVALTQIEVARASPAGSPTLQ